jgi:hypothetical protein
VRPVASAGTPRGGEARPEGCGGRTDGRGPASLTYVRLRMVTWRAQACGSAAQRRIPVSFQFGLPRFD